MTQDTNTESVQKPPNTMADGIPNTLPDTLIGSVARGTALMVLLRFSVRLSGLVSISIVARILSPDDFAIVASASLILGLFVLLQNFGFSEIIIKNKNLPKEQIDTIWTMQLLLSAAVSLLVFISAPVLTSWTGDTRITPVLRVIAIIPLLTALASPASPIFIRDMAFGREFILKLVQKWAQIILTISAAIYFRSYWALVIGMVAGTLVNTVITYGFHTFRPQLSLKSWPEYKTFALSTIWRDIAIYFSTSSDEFIVRKLAPSPLFGEYHVARDLGRIFITELISPVRTSLLPAVSILAKSTKRLSHSVHKFNAAIFLLALPVTAGVILTAPDFIPIILGSGWQNSIPFLQVTAVGIASNSVSSAHLGIFTAINRQSHAAKFWTIRFSVILFAALLAYFVFLEALAVGIAFSLSSFLITCFEVKTLRNLIVCPGNILSILWRPTIATTSMAGFVMTVSPLMTEAPLLFNLMAKIIAGAAIYILTIFLLWFFSNKPEGIENILYHRLIKH